MPPQTISGAGYSADVLEFMRLLRRFEVRCIVVGGEAVIFHGYPRFTGDIDFFYDCTPSNADRLYDALLEFWAGDIPGIGAREELLEPGVVIQFGRPPYRIDLHSCIDGVTFEEAWQSRVPVQIESGDEAVEIDFIGLEPLRRNKHASARPKDLDDLEHLPGGEESPGRRSELR